MSQWFSVKIKNEILTWFFILSIIPMIIMIGSNLYMDMQTYKNNVLIKLESQLSDKVRELENKIEFDVRNLKMMSFLPNLIDSMKYYNFYFKEHKKVDLSENKHHNNHDS